MLVLFETPAGHALFTFSSGVHPSELPDLESSIVKHAKLKAFHAFSSTTTALSSVASLIDSKATKDLRKFLKANLPADESLLVGDAKLASNLKDKTGLKCIFDKSAIEIMRAIRANVDELLETQNSGRKEMVLGLAHSLSRYKLKFSPDKVDTMIVQAINLLDELDKEINVYSMRLREWYGWHFPELGKIVTENAPYARLVQKMGMRSSADECDFSDCIPEHVEEEVKAAAKISMGTEISDHDLLNIRSLCEQVISLFDYRATLYEYLKSRMAAIAPNLTVMVGELVGARLIAHAGSLMSLAKCPASTVQILGAEKALFRALKTKHATPKYGLIYHASVVGQAAPKNKGKISRTLAAKCALAIRVDALSKSGDDASVGEEGRRVVEARLSQLEGKPVMQISRLAKVEKQDSAYKSGEGKGKKYHEAEDFGVKNEEEVEEKIEMDDEEPSDRVEKAVVSGENGHEANGSERKKKKKKKKDKEKKRAREAEDEMEDVEEGSSERKKKKKKKKRKKE